MNRKNLKREEAFIVTFISEKLPERKEVVFQTNTVQYYTNYTILILNIELPSGNYLHTLKNTNYTGKNRPLNFQTFYSIDFCLKSNKIVHSFLTNISY